MPQRQGQNETQNRLPPHGGSGLKSISLPYGGLQKTGLPPHGGSGLKWFSAGLLLRFSASPSTRREWIEILLQTIKVLELASPSTRREWIEIFCAYSQRPLPQRLPPHGGSGLKLRRMYATAPEITSPSTRREWIEIRVTTVKQSKTGVSLHTEGVD